jgi:hypothetical protein
VRQLGHLMNPRDERNWMIPREGTQRRRIYDALVSGKRAGLIMQELGLSRRTYNSERYFITSWAKANARAYAVKNR